MAMKACLLLLAVCFLKIKNSSSQAKCPRLEEPDECRPEELIEHECDLNEDCPGDNNLCCSNTCERKCVAGFPGEINANSCPDPQIPDNCGINATNNECQSSEECPIGHSCCQIGCDKKCYATNITLDEVCTVPVDLAFIIDASGSIGSVNFGKILQFVAKIVDAFEIKENGTHVGVIYYSDNAHLAFDFNKFKGAELNKQNVVDEINKISVTEGQTRIDLALKMARNKLFTVEGGMRPDKPKIALVMTDGQQTIGPSAPEAEDLHVASRPLKEQGVQVYALGIGLNYDIGELLDIASDDASVFRSSDVDELVSIVAMITGQTCKGCTNPVDIHFAIDSSKNVGEFNFEDLKNFVKEIGYKFVISETGSHISASVFGNDATIVFNLNKALTQDDYLIEADRIPYLGDDKAKIDTAIRLVEKKIFTLDGSSRQKSSKVLVILTASNCGDCDEDLSTAVENLKRDGVQVVVVPIGNNPKQTEVESLASLPIQQFVNYQADFEQLSNKDFVRRLSSMICQGKPGVCEEPPLPKDCPKIVYNCEVDVDCPNNRKCCFKNCEKSCEEASIACIAPLDVVFAFETTQKGEGNFKDMKTLASNLLNNFKIDGAGSHFALATFSDATGYLSPFGKNYKQNVVKSKIQALKSDGGSVSNIGNFLEFINQDMFTVSNGARQSQPRVLVIFTNGEFPKSQEQIAEQAATKLKADGKDVSIIIVSVGKSNSVFKNIASSPSAAKIVNVNNSKDLLSQQIERQIASEICSMKTRRRECIAPREQNCKTKTNICNSDIDCPGFQECHFDGCRRVCVACKNICADKVDLLVILDDSADVGKKGFEKSKDFVKTFMEWFTVSQQNTHVAVMTYSNNGLLKMPLPPPGSSEPKQTIFDLSNKINELKFTGGANSNLDKALSTAAAQVFPPDNLGRKDSKKVVIIVTDGNSDSSERLDVASWPLRKQKVQVKGVEKDAIRIIAVSVGDKINIKALENVVTPPINENVFVAATFDDMFNTVRQLAVESCEYKASNITPPIELIPGDPGPPGPKGEKGQTGMDGMKGNTGLLGPKGDPGETGAKGMKGAVGPTGPSGDEGDQKGPDPNAGAVGIIEGTAVPGRGNIVYDLRDGPQGPPGLTGKLGETGLPGDVGAKGKQGREGAPGPRGPFGKSGQKGEPGKDGKPGLSGELGGIGTKGLPGPLGSQGPPGAQGPFGYKGEQGDGGIVGIPGENGVKGSKGYRGEKGDQGDVGKAGFPGEEGPPGPTGPPGQRGLRGPDGARGPPGDSTETGAKGRRGPKGTAGTKGQQGSSGARGEKGSVGKDGAQGDQGKTGPLGIRGAEGIPGSAGPDGATGLKGPPGATGTVGQRGEIGPQGKIGTIGLPGFKGTRGEPGRRGVSGAKGESGDPGELGPPGPPGQSGKQGKIGSTGPRGPQGLTGHQGLSGQVGDSGLPGGSGLKGNLGKPGVNGPDGEKGSRGYDGEVGAKGFPGEMGNVGAPGLPGRDGKDGRQGINGKDGEQGAQGPQGMQGQPGAVGTSGANGDPGETGSQGNLGKLGPKGLRGTAGKIGQIGSVGPPGLNGLRGERGDQGPAGTPGRQGPPGARGEIGLQGNDGVQGNKGSSGRPGNPGLMGEQGVPGAPGLTGTTGTPGKVGERGDAGRDGGLGDQGPTGLPGRPGQPGRDGTPGRPGRRGTQGSGGKPGIPGPNGFKGADGQPGARGPEGIAGNKGVPGLRGSPGPNGNPGADGTEGLTGDIGESGKPGMPGSPGPPGFRGPPGVPGTRGSKGINGDRGDDGEVGLPGVQGDVGPLGTPGDVGDVGSIGELGDIGEEGQQGPLGRQGPPGPPGPEGIPGPPGLIGKDGNKGPLGDPGDIGRAGKAGDAGNPGKDGVPGNPGIPGKQGEPGLQGPSGPQGPPGEPGPRGVLGLIGKTGETGPKGYAGKNGIPGTPGKKGPRGKEGAPGQQGPVGKDGRPGKDGFDGTDGTNGIDGLKGDPGERGENGAVGAPGDVGPAGNTGPPGEVGDTGVKGPNGSPGIPGKRGEIGESGDVGPKGKSGTEGRTGSKGIKGRMGRPGIQGPPGDIGLKGEEGFEGPTGHSGPQGIPGDSGRDGINGTKGLKGVSGNSGQIGNEGMIGSPGDSGIPGTSGLPGPPGPPGLPGDVTGALAGNFWDRVTAGGVQKGPRRWYGSHYGRYRRSTDDDSPNDVQKIIKRNYDQFKEFDSLWTKIMDEYFVKQTIGSQSHPAPTCRDLFMSRPALKSGDYWIDPNEGASSDAILVYCNATSGETCIYPRITEIPKGSWHSKSSKLQWAYKDLMKEENRIMYAGDVVQLKMVKLLNNVCRQNITYHCKNSKDGKLKVMTDNSKVYDVKKVPVDLEMRELLNECSISDGKWHRNEYEFISVQLEHFPILDVGKNVHNKEEFGLSIGPVCCA